MRKNNVHTYFDGAFLPNQQVNITGINTCTLKLIKNIPNSILEENEYEIRNKQSRLIYKDYNLGLNFATFRSKGNSYAAVLVDLTFIPTLTDAKYFFEKLNAILKKLIIEFKIQQLEEEHYNLSKEAESQDIKKEKEIVTPQDPEVLISGFERLLRDILHV